MSKQKPGRLFGFGLGYSARALAKRLRADTWRIAGTAQSAESCAAFEAAGIEAFPFRSDAPLREAARRLAGTTYLLSSVPPDEEGDPVLRHHAKDIAAVPGLRWVGYLSTTGVYGDKGGAWVDENSELRPSGERGRRRVAAERSWLELGETHGLAVHIFRLAGIYGPGRNALETLRKGKTRRIQKPGQVFSRIHVEDLAETLLRSMAVPRAGRIYNVCDDEPASPEDVILYAASLLNLPAPPPVAYEDADLSEMAKSFYADNKRVRNDRMKRELGVKLRYPDYRVGLKALLASPLSE
ncbi:MAG: SDR family oxidoreductase [Alphaproteobacteria bacterium]